MNEDYITELVFWRAQAKTYRDGIKQPFEKAARCRAVVHKLECPEDLFQIVHNARSKTNSCFIRGVPGEMKIVYYRNGQNFDELEEGHFWMCLDIDKLTCPDWLEAESWRVKLEYVISQLPPEFHDVTTYYHWSSSAGFSRDDEGRLNLSVHLWYWANKRITDKEGQMWAKIVGVDTRTFVTVQPIFESDPILINTPDPFIADERAGRRRGDKDIVDIDLSTAQRAIKERAEAAQKMSASVGSYLTANPNWTPTGRFDQILDEIGNPNVNTPVWRAMLSWINSTGPGSRTDLMKNLIWDRIKSSSRSGDYLNKSWLDGKLREAYSVASHTQNGPDVPRSMIRLAKQKLRG